MSITVLSEDHQLFEIPLQYHQCSDYFNTVNHYQETSELSIPSQLSVEFDLIDLQLILIPVDQLDHSQVITSYVIDRFFQHRPRMEQLELTIINGWLIGTYLSSEVSIYHQVSQLVDSIIFSNIRMATKIWLRGLHHRHYDHQLSLLANRIYWVEVRQQLLENIDLEDLYLLPQEGDHDYPRYLRLVERLTNGRSDMYDIINQSTSNDGVNLANDYLALINGIQAPIKFQLAALIRYQDLGNPHLNHLYRTYIVNHLYQYGLDDNKKLSYYQLIDLINSQIMEYTDHHYHNDTRRPGLFVFENCDERVIKEFLTIMTKHGLNRITSSHIRHLYQYGSPAAIRLFKLDTRKIARETKNPLTLAEWITDETNNNNHLGWNCLSKCGDEYREKLIGWLITTKIDLISDILKTPDRAHLIPCTLLFHYDRQLANLIAQLGGRLKLRDLDNSPRRITLATVEFVLNYGYVADDEDLEYINQCINNKQITDERIIKLLINRVDEVKMMIRPVIEMPLIDELIKLKPDMINLEAWMDTIMIIDEYLVGGHRAILNERHLRRYNYHNNITTRTNQFQYYDRLLNYIRGVRIDNDNCTRLITLIEGWLAEEEARTDVDMDDHHVNVIRFVDSDTLQFQVFGGTVVVARR